MKPNILFIFDWDDTLYPTHWLLYNNIKINNKKDVGKYLLYFQELDKLLLKLLQMASQNGSVIIITNANESWVSNSMKSLPKTANFIDENVKVVSARDIYQDTHDIDDWKIMTFNYSIYNYVNWANQIVSFGDADYEHNALISLSRRYAPYKYLKLIRLMKEPTFDILLDQLNSIIRSLPQICKTENHMDLTFRR